MCRTLSILVAISLFAYTQDSHSNDFEQARHIEKIKGSLKKFGRYSEVKVRLRDDIRLAGYVSEMGYDSFLLTSQVTKSDRWVRYENVRSVKGPGLRTSSKIAIGAAVGAGTVITILAILFHDFT